MRHQTKQSVRIIVSLCVGLMVACAFGQTEEDTPLSPARPANFEVQTATPTSAVAVATPLPTFTPEQPATLFDAPTHTPVPNSTPTLIPAPDVTPTAVIIPTNTPAIAPPTATLVPVPSPTPTATETVPVAESETAVDAPTNPPTVTFAGELDPPLRGGEWDFEADFYLWENPFGDCSGALVGRGWTAFVEDGPYGSSCMGENLFGGDVQSGRKSQEITFDFIAANSGLLRTIDTRPGHQYQIIAHAKHVRSLAPVQMSLGVDFTGGTAWNGATVEWTAWDSAAEDVWKSTERVVTATGESMTIFIKGYHPTGDQGGKTFIDNVSVTHLGP